MHLGFAASRVFRLFSVRVLRVPFIVTVVTLGSESPLYGGRPHSFRDTHNLGRDF